MTINTYKQIFDILFFIISLSYETVEQMNTLHASQCVWFIKLALKWWLENNSGQSRVKAKKEKLLTSK